MQNGDKAKQIVRSKAPPKVCNDVGELIAAVGAVTADCKLVRPVEVSYELHDGEGYIRIELARDK